MQPNLPPLRAVLLYSAFPVVATMLGGAISLIKSPGPRLRGGLQHFAAGVVFSVVSVEILPDIVKRHLPWEVAAGFSVGVAAMLALKKLTSISESSAALVGGVAVDFAVDGMLIGFAFSAGEKQRTLLTLALAVEVCSIGMALTSTLRKSNSRLRVAATVTGLASVIALAAVLGASLLRSASAKIMEVTLAFGLAALLFLVTEELLVEAHEEPETLAGTTMFFVGFILFLIIGMVS